MPLSRASLESLIALRHGALMRLVGFDTVTVDGTNPVMGLAIGTVLRSMGLEVADPLSPSNGDLEGIPAARIGEFLDDRLPLTIWDLIVGNWDAYDEKENTTSQDAGSLMKLLLSWMQAKRTRIETAYAASETASAPVSGVQCDVPPCPCPAPYPARGYQPTRWI